MNPPSDPPDAPGMTVVMLITVVRQLRILPDRQHGRGPQADQQDQQVTTTDKTDA